MAPVTNIRYVWFVGFSWFHGKKFKKILKKKKSEKIGEKLKKLEIIGKNWVMTKRDKQTNAISA